MLGNFFRNWPIRMQRVQSLSCLWSGTFLFTQFWVRVTFRVTCTSLRRLALTEYLMNPATRF